MLGKLLKYEFKSTSRTFIPMYIAILLVSIINRMFMNTDMFEIRGITSMVLTALFVALGVLTIVVIIQRFRKNLLEDEGYLMFTLPVSIKSIIFSKYLTSIIWTFFSGIIAIVAFLIIMSSTDGGHGFIEYIDMIKMLWNSIIENNLWVMIINVFINLISMYSIFIFTIYISLSMGQLPKFNKHRNATGLVMFFGLNIVVSNVLYFISDLVSSNLIKYIDSYDILPVLTGINTLVFILVLIVLFNVINYILNRKLNLE